MTERGTCNTTDDCTLIGGQLVLPTCDCVPYVVSCGGEAIETNAPQLARVRQMIDQFVGAGCAAATKACDCAPSGPLACGVDHRCTAAQRSCFVQPPPDAASDAATLQQ